MWQNTKITQQLDIALPIIQGPFGGGASSVELVVAVSEAGGLGSYGANHLSPLQIKEIAKEIRARTDRPFALNLWIPFQGSDVASVTQEEFSAEIELLRPYFAELNLPLPTCPKQFSPNYDEQN